MAPPVKYNSRYNTGMRWYWPMAANALLGVGITILGWTNPTIAAITNDPTVNLILPGVLGTMVGNGANDVFNRLFARPTSTVDQAYQEAYILPDSPAHKTAGYLVIQPHHHKSGWRQRDAIAFKKTPRLLGWTATLDQAQELCRMYTKDAGQRLDPSQMTPAWQTLMDRAALQYGKNPTKFQNEANNALTGIWRAAQVSPTDPAVIAYRTRYTAQGRQTEFYPSPPETVATGAALQAYLENNRLFANADRALPVPLPQGSDLWRTPDLREAWHFQRLQTVSLTPWTLINVAPESAIPRWTMGCAVRTLGGPPTWHFFPKPPHTVEDGTQLMQQMQALATPGVATSGPDATPWPVAITPPLAALSSWHRQAEPAPRPTAPAVAAPALPLQAPVPPTAAHSPRLLF